MFSTISKFACAAAICTASLTATPAMASTLVIAQCDSVTDGDADGCLFTGNINGQADPTHVNGYKHAEAEYNALMNPDITLNWITKTDDLDFSTFGTFTGFDATTGQFSLPGWDIEFYAVKAGPRFWLYENLGSNNWSIPRKNGMSHIAFFGTQITTAVPEPGTWAMMLFGFGAIGVGMRRRRRTGQTLLQVA